MSERTQEPSHLPVAQGELRATNGQNAKSDESEGLLKALCNIQRDGVASGATWATGGTGWDMRMARGLRGLHERRLRAAPLDRQAKAS